MSVDNKCVQCGQVIEAGTKFCPYCGVKLPELVNKNVGNLSTVTNTAADQYASQNNIEVSGSKNSTYTSEQVFNSENIYKSTKLELYRRIILILAVIIGVGMIGYVVPALVTVEWVDFKGEQAHDLKGFVTQEKQRLGTLTLEEYIKEKTSTNLIQLDSAQWGSFFNEIYLASSGQYGKSIYAERVSEMDKDSYSTPGEDYVEVFFNSSELPIQAWRLDNHLDTIYLSTVINGKIQYLRAIYWDYSNPVDRPYIQPPLNLMNPLRTMGFIILVLGILLAFIIPRSKPEIGDIVYKRLSIIAGDIAGLMLFGAFVALPVLINEGTVQAFTHWLIVTIVFAIMAAPCVFLFYTNAWHASYRLRLVPEGLMRITFRGLEPYAYNDIISVEKVALIYPKWFLRTFKIVMLFSLLSGRGVSVGGAGQFLLASSASYAGLEVKRSDGQSMLIWYSDQLGNVILPGYEQIVEACRERGITINDEMRLIRGFMYYK